MSDVEYLTAAQILFIHSRLITETGGGPGLRDLGLLESAVARPRATFDGSPLYPDIFTKAAVLMESLVRNHPFIDGSERVGITAASLFLVRNGRQLVTTNDELEHFTMAVARSERSLAEIAEWFSEHSQAARS